MNAEVWITSSVNAVSRLEEATAPKRNLTALRCKVVHVLVLKDLDEAASFTSRTRNLKEAQSVNRRLVLPDCQGQRVGLVSAGLFVMRDGASMAKTADSFTTVQRLVVQIPSVQDHLHWSIFLAILAVHLHSCHPLRDLMERMSVMTANMGDQ